MQTTGEASNDPARHHQSTILLQGAERLIEQLRQVSCIEEKEAECEAAAVVVDGGIGQYAPSLGLVAPLVHPLVLLTGTKSRPLSPP